MTDKSIQNIARLLVNHPEHHITLGFRVHLNISHDVESDETVEVELLSALGLRARLPISLDGLEINIAVELQNRRSTFFNVDHLPDFPDGAAKNLPQSPGVILRLGAL